jgi:site-specific recombinase XerD
VLGTFFRWCVKRNYCFIDPTTNVESLRTRTSQIPKYMSREELSRFFKECSDKERRIFSILLLSGMRKGELIHLQWQDVRLSVGLLFIRTHRDEDGTEVWAPKVEERIIPISPALDQVLREHKRAEGTATPWVVTNRNGNQERHLLEKLKRICRKANIPKEVSKLHALRHSFGSHLRMAGVPLESISELLGHRDLSSTRIYAKADMTHLRNAANRVGHLVSRENVTQRPIREQVARKALKTNELDKGNPGWLGRRESLCPHCGNSLETKSLEEHDTLV